ncbi:MAG: 30S ribosomal protein S12 methylthiotransferase RimO [Ignavibacteriales bacterium]|nr:30S ribosomal protein S12 methylthiotransferase RimO [Ignavibacteriales bacterium]
MKNFQPPKISVVTLGCSKNVVDSEVLLGQLRLNNASVVGDVDDAEIAVINTCGFIEAAKQESIDAIMEAVRKKNQGQLKKIVVMGCLSERFAKELSIEIPEVDAFFGSNQLKDVATELGIDYKQELLGERQLTTPSHFAYLKISEGCDNPCSFCAIPLMRGLHRTKPFEQVIEEARLLAAKGVKELIIIGQDTTYYGLDLYGRHRLDALLSEISSIDGIEWIRLMYAYPAKFPKEILKVYQVHPKLCRYLDIPVQHASDAVLKSMRRGITNRAMRDLLHEIKAGVPNIALRTTLIVGYPNETEKDFEVLCDFVKEMKFHRLGAFTYSQEEGTFAYDLGDPIPANVKEERCATIMQIQQEISAERNQSLQGVQVKVLLDRREGEFMVGRTEWDAPEIDQEVYVRNKDTVSVGNFCDVTIVDTTEYDLYADVV